MTKKVKKHDYQKENEEKLVDLLYQATLKEYPGIPIPDEELAKELLRVGVKARCGAEELTTLKDHLTPYKDEDIRKIHEEKMQLVTVTEFNMLHKEKLEAERKLAKTVEALENIRDAEYQFAEGYNYDSDSVIINGEECSLDELQKIAKQALAEIGGEDD